MAHHLKTWEQPAPPPPSRGMGPSGSTLAATAGDLVRFGRIFLRGGSGILSAAAVAEMHTPQVDVPSRWFADSWCVGPYRKRWDGVDVFGHSGSNLGGSSTLLWVPERDVAVAVIVNTPARGYAFADAVFDVLFPSFGIAKPRRPEPDPSVEIDPRRYAGRYEAHGFGYVRAGAAGDRTAAARRLP
ncbi:serine hydrolase [Spongiactinospora gelatinilytica]|nr:serine hydrolase [Spongiactinospora gelatinilytica]